MRTPMVEYEVDEESRRRPRGFQPGHRPTQGVLVGSAAKRNVAGRLATCRIGRAHRKAVRRTTSLCVVCRNLRSADELLGALVEAYRLRGGEDAPHMAKSTVFGAHLRRTERTSEHKSGANEWKTLERRQ